MKKRAIISIFLAAAVFVLIVSHTTSATQTQLPVSQMPPEVAHTLGVLKLHELEKQRVTMTLWSSDDAASRMENIELARAAEADPNYTHIGVNIADPEALYEGYLLRDGLSDDPYQLLATAETAEQLFSTYGYTTLHQ